MHEHTRGHLQAGSPLHNDDLNLVGSFLKGEGEKESLGDKEQSE